jgi:hypothetical protein
MAQKVNQNRKESAAKPSLSCNNEYFKLAKTLGAQRLPEFLTEDEVELFNYIMVIILGGRVSVIFNSREHHIKHS